jgi:hypothetical protein
MKIGCVGRPKMLLTSQQVLLHIGNNMGTRLKLLLEM